MSGCRSTFAPLFVGLLLLLFGPLRAEPPSLETLTAQSQMLRRQGDIGGALAVLAAAHREFPDAFAVSKDIEDIVQNGLPASLSRETLGALPVETTDLPGSLGVFVSPRSYLPTPATEPQHGWQFTQAVTVYLSPSPSQTIPKSQTTLRALCRVHFTRPDDTQLARRVAGLLALAHKTWTSKTRRPAAYGLSVFDVWLCRGGQTGGEEWRSNIYFYDLDAVRSSIEWVREIAHEYSHLALTPIGGYKQPEYWANGYLGERLILRWWQRTPGDLALVEKVWGDFSGVVNFDRILVKPALAIYKKIGPNKSWTQKTDDEGMRWLIGLTLTQDDKFGAKRVGDALARLPRFREARASDLLDAFRNLQTGKK